LGQRNARCVDGKFIKGRRDLISSCAVQIRGIATEKEQLVGLQLLLGNGGSTLDGVVGHSHAFSARNEGDSAKGHSPGVRVAGKDAESVSDHRVVKRWVVAQAD